MSELVLILVAILGRLAGASARQGTDRSLVRALGWLTCMSANWLVVGAFGAWFPLWPVLALGVLGALVDTSRTRLIAWLAGDLLVVVLCGSLSIPPMPLSSLMLLAIGVAAGGLVLDGLARMVPALLRRAALSGAVVAWALVAVTMVQTASAADDRKHWKYVWDLFSPHMSVSSPRLPGTERIILDTGAIAWLDRPSGPGPFPGALFFHGADARGSHQPAAVVARRALVDAGFMVLALDHPGYADSPTPSISAGIEAWDPSPSVEAAYHALHARSDVDWILAVGHSMGVSDVLGLLGTEADLAAAVLFGAAASTPMTPYWYERFHTDRHLEQGSVPIEKWRDIHRFYDRNRLATLLPDRGVPILFAIHEIEPAHARHERDLLYELLPEPKELWPLGGATHYFSTAQRAGLLIGDTTVSTELSAGLRRFARQVSQRQPALAGAASEPAIQSLQ